jgi:hypothetical protein
MQKFNVDRIKISIWHPEAFLLCQCGEEANSDLPTWSFLKWVSREGAGAESLLWEEGQSKIRYAAIMSGPDFVRIKTLQP